MAGEQTKKKKKAPKHTAEGKEISAEALAQETQEPAPEVVSMPRQVAEEVVEAPEGETRAPPDLLSEMPAPSPLDTAIRSLVNVLLPGPEQPVLTEEAASSASAALGRMAMGADDSLSLIIAQSDGVLQALSHVCNSARSDSARAAAAESLGILARNDANKVAIRCTSGFARGLIRVCAEAADRVERRSVLLRTARDVTLALKEAEGAAKRAAKERSESGLAPDPWEQQELDATVRFLQQQRSEALRELETDVEPASAAADAMVAGASTLACLMESTATIEQAAKSAHACNKRILNLDKQVQQAKQILAAAGSAERSTHRRLGLLYAFNNWLHSFKPVDQHDRTLLAAAHEARHSAMRRTVEATAVVRRARKAYMSKQRELTLANSAWEKAKAVEVAAALGPDAVHVDSSDVANLKLKVSHLENLCAQRQRQADASSVKLLKHKQRQRSLLHPPIVSWEPRGIPRQAGAYLARTQRQLEAVAARPGLQQDFEALAREELARLSPQPLPGFLTSYPKAADLMASTLEQVCEGKMGTSETMEKHLWAAARLFAQANGDTNAADIAHNYRVELVQWMEQTDLARAIGDLRATREACRDAVVGQSLAFAVYQAADVNKEALGQRAIATLTRVCAVAENNGAKAKAATALGALATHEGLATWMVVESRGCLRALARVIDLQCGAQNEASTPQAVSTKAEVGGHPLRRHQQPHYFICDREEAWTCAAKALGVVASWHPRAVASTPGVVESLTAMCTDAGKLATKHCDAVREAAATTLGHLVGVGLCDCVEDLRRRYPEQLRRARCDRQAKASQTLQQQEQQGNEGKQQQEAEKNGMEVKIRLGQWTQNVTLYDVVAGLVTVCTTAGTPTAQAAAATALANLISPANYGITSQCYLTRNSNRIATGMPSWDDARAGCAAAISSSGAVVDVCVQLCSAEASGEGSVGDCGSSQQRVVEASSRLLMHLAAVDACSRERIVEVGGLDALVHVCNTAEADSTLSPAAGALDYCSYVNGAVQKLGEHPCAINALVRCCKKLNAGSEGLAGAAGVLCVLARNGFYKKIRDTDGAAQGLSKVCEVGPTDGKMFAARCLSWLAAA